MDIRVFNFPGHPDIPQASMVDVAGLEGTAFYCSPDTEAALGAMFPANASPCINFLGSGDYHYMTKILTDKASAPFNLLLLDNHPDMQAPAFGDILSCGGWVRKMLESNPFLRKVAILGIDPDLAEECAGFPGRVSVLTQDCAFSERWLDAALGRGSLYISIDKDVLGHEFAATDWSQGSMDIETLCRVLRFASSVNEVMGVDICGALAVEKGATSEDVRVNEASDRAILCALGAC